MPKMLGRTVWHDNASKSFPASAASKLRTVMHAHHGPVLDQGSLGSCTGNAIVQMLNTDPFRAALEKKGIALLTEREAVGFYAIATTIDPYVGRWPAQDTGSSGLSVAKAAKKAGLILQYQHAFGIDHMLGALVLTPVIVGVPWYESMYEPAQDGTVTVSGQVVGGHEFAVIGIDVEKSRVLALNSWGENWGNAGTFWISFEDMSRLLKEQGDCTVAIL